MARTLTGVVAATTADVKLSLCADVARDEFMSYCNRDDVPEQAESLVGQIAVIRYNAIGTEGLISQGFSGTSESYCQEYPAHIKAQLDRFRRVKLL